MAYLVDELADALEKAKQQGCKVLVSPVPAAAFGGRRISFVMMPNMLMVEFIEKTHA
jgi:methylmalonyl-CoA/ethylmalonyl-CoA epimerase